MGTESNPVTFSDSDLYFWEKVGAGFGMKYIKCMEKHGRDGHRAGSGGFLFSLLGPSVRLSLRLKPFQRTSHTAIQTFCIPVALERFLDSGGGVKIYLCKFRFTPRP